MEFPTTDKQFKMWCLEIAYDDNLMASKSEGVVRIKLEFPPTERTRIDAPPSTDEDSCTSTLTRNPTPTIGAVFDLPLYSAVMLGIPSILALEYVIFVVHPI